LVMAMLEILPHEMDLAHYLAEIVNKLRRISQIHAHDSDEEEKDYYALFGESQKKKKVKEADVVMEASQEKITFEEVLMLRLVFEISEAIKSTRSTDYSEFLESIVPEFEEYRRMVMAIVTLKEENLPMNASVTENKIKPYPVGQIGFTRRAILGEMIKFSMHLNLRDETVRNNLVSLFFNLISNIDHSFSDYEHLLRTRKFMITETKQLDKHLQDVDADISDIEGVDNSVQMDQEEYKQVNQEQEVTFTIRNFLDVDFGRSLQEYCKPYVLEPMTLDYDDVTSVTVSVVRRLLYTRIDDF